MKLLRKAVFIAVLLCFAGAAPADERAAERKTSGEEVKDQKKKSGKVQYRKVQEVSFDDEELDGIVRNPMGSYVTDKKTMKFLPLYQVKEKMEQRLLESLEYLK